SSIGRSNAAVAAGCLPFSPDETLPIRVNTNSWISIQRRCIPFWWARSLSALLCALQTAVKGPIGVPLSSTVSGIWPSYRPQSITPLIRCTVLSSGSHSDDSTGTDARDAPISRGIDTSKPVLCSATQLHRYVHTWHMLH